MRHLKKYADRINTKYEAEYCTKLLETNYPISFHMDPAPGWCNSVGNQMVEVTKPNRNR